MILAVILVGLIAAPLALLPVGTVEAQGVPGGSGGYTIPTSYQATLDSAPPVEVDKCKLTNPSSWGKCILDGWRFVIEWTTINFLNWLVGLTGGLLDFFIKFSLNSSFFKDNLAISNAWKLIRDLVNMGFIFIMLYIAISTILQLSSYNIKSMLVKLIIAAVFINFSLFITKVVMDAGNIIALNFYNALSVPVLVDGNIVNQPNIGKTFQNYLGIQDKYDPRTGEKVDLDSVSAFFNTVMRAITQIIVIYVFLSLAFVFIARVIAFIFLMIFSPIGFIGAVFPGASGAAAKWRKTLIDQTLVAPVFLILIYLVVQVIGSGIFKISLPDFSDPNGVVKVDAAFYFNYIIIIGLLLMTKKITKGLSGEMGAMVEKFGKKALAVAGGAALAVATGGAAMGIRGSIAAAGSFAAGAKNAPTGGFKGRVAGGWSAMKQDFSSYSRQKAEQKKTEIAKAFKEGSYDIRRAKLPFIKGPTLGEAAKTYMGVDVGKPMSPVERAREKEKFEKERKEDVSRKQFDKDKNDLQVAVNASDNRTIFAILQGGTDSHGVTHSGITDKKVTDLPDEILKKVGSQMKGSQFEAIMKGDFEQEVKGAISQNRTAKIQDAINSGTAADLKTAVQDLKMKPVDIAKLKADWLKSDKFVEIMNTQMLPKILEELQPSDFDEIKDKIKIRASAAGATPSDLAMKKWLKTNSLI